jgi:hypothetical protein
MTLLREGFWMFAKSLCRSDIMLFIVRGKNSKQQDGALRVHAETAKEAEEIGWKRGLFVTEVIPVSHASSECGKLDQVAELLHKMWRYTPTNAFKAFGRSLSNGQAAALLILGLTTWMLDMRVLVFH